MESGWRLGPHGYAPEARLVPPGGAVPGCAWMVVRREGDGSRWLLQLWDPCPPAPVLDTFKDEFLHRFSRTEPLDPGACHLGCDRDRAWLLQALCGLPAARVQDAAAGLQDLCSGLPEASRPAFLGRSDILAFREAAERAGMTISWPPAADPLPDWNVARPGTARAPSLRAKP